MSVSRAFLAGVRDMSPMLLGVVPFGVVAGLAVVEIGLGALHALGFSIGIFAGAAQLASVDLLGADAHLAVVVGTALVINSRMLMYSASIAPHLAGEPLPRRALASYLLVDQVYALSVIRYGVDPDPATRLPYYLGSGAILWVCWQLANLVGVLVGGAIPESVPLGFAVPMTFIALIVPTVSDRPTVA
ncbi:MAG: AzlC family ABC transporter permease, partial [Nitriliruptorales bacterium]